MNELTAPLPARWGTLQRLKNTAIFLLVRAAFLCLEKAPGALTHWLCNTFARVATLLPLKDTQRALEHIAAAFPELFPEERQRLVGAMYLHLGRSVAEVIHLRQLLDRVRLGANERAILDAAFAEGKGVVAVTGHIGNWELLAQVVAKAGYPVTTIAKPLYDPRLTRWVHQERTRYGLQLVWRGEASASKDMLRVFKSGGMLALLIDQDTKVQGAFVPFFGRPAHTPTAAAALALRFDAPVIVAWHARVGDAHQFHFERVPVEKSGDDEADVLALTTRITGRLEQAIRARPEQWVWMHRRWRKQPEPPPAERAPASR